MKDHMDEDQARRVLGESWFRRYLRSTRKHFQDYKRKKNCRHEHLSIKSERHWRDHILVGYRTKSFWMGKNGVDLAEYLGGLVRRRDPTEKTYSD